MFNKLQVAGFQTIVGDVFTVAVQRNGNAQVNIKDMAGTPNEDKLIALHDAYKLLKAKDLDVSVQFGFAGSRGQVTWPCLWINDTAKPTQVDHRAQLEDLFEKAIELDIDTSPTTKLPEAGQAAWLKRAIAKAQITVPAGTEVPAEDEQPI